MGKILVGVVWGWHASAQSNIVYNGGFEILPVWSGWVTDANLAGSVGERGAADGVNWPTLGGAAPIGAIYTTNYCTESNLFCSIEVTPIYPPYQEGSIWQDLETVPGRTYRIQFAFIAVGKSLRVHWGEEVVDMISNVPGSLPERWAITNYLVTATSTLTRLRFENPLGNPYYVPLDAVSVVWVEEPVSILAQPQDREVYAGGRSGFRVLATGAPPLTYQWFHNDQPLGGENSHILAITEATAGDAGSYRVEVSNAFGTVSSEVANLVLLQPPSVPEIVRHPADQTLAAGYQPVLSVVAIGEAPLIYQWRKNGGDIPDATNMMLTVDTTTTLATDIFDVRVSNDHGSALSLGASVTATNGAGGAVVVVANLVVGHTGLERYPIYDLDGTTPLQGPAYSFQLYAGVTETSLRPVGMVWRDLVLGLFAGRNASIPDVSPNNTVYVQIRAWESSKGTTFESARANGGKYGSSVIFGKDIPAGPPSPQDTIGFPSFSLEAGLPAFTTGRIHRGKRIEGGKFEWVLEGEPGFRYLVERRYPPQSWAPLMVITNVTGKVSFVDPAPQNAAVAFYRTRMLD